MNSWPTDEDVERARDAILALFEVKTGGPEGLSEPDAKRFVADAMARAALTAVAAQEPEEDDPGVGAGVDGAFVGKAGDGLAASPPAQGEPVAALCDLAGWLEQQRGLLGAVDGYNYHSGEEYGLRRALIEVERRVKVAAASSQGELVARLNEALSAFDEEVAANLASEGERADLWTDIDLPVALIREAAATLTRMGEWERLYKAAKQNAVFGDGDERIREGAAAIVVMRHTLDAATTRVTKLEAALRSARGLIHEDRAFDAASVIFAALSGDATS